MNIREAKEQIEHAVKLYLEKDEKGRYIIPIEKQRPVFLMGAPGIGKTAIMEQVAQELGVALVSYTMTHHTRQSALGLPYIVEKEYGGEKFQVSEYTMSEIIAAVYEVMEDTGIREGILFLDEINCVSETLAPAMLQFLQYKTFGQHKVPEGWIIIHLGMSGSLRILPEELPPEKHDHVDLVMNNGKVLRYTDPRRFGAWLWTKELEGHNVLAHLGPEPLSDDFNGEYLHQKCAKKKTAIKPWLMDNKLVVGVGNIYASESLFAAGIHPDRLASSLSLAECELLARVIKAVLLRSIEQGGTTLKDFLQSDGKPGYFAQELQVYGRKGEPCRVCGTPIVATKHAQRATFYCRQCQK